MTAHASQCAEGALSDNGELDYQIEKRGGISIPVLLPVCLCLIAVVLLHLHIT